MSLGADLGVRGIRKNVESKRVLGLMPARLAQQE